MAPTSPPHSAVLARLLVCERNGMWAAALRRALPPKSPRIEELRTLAECAPALDASPASFGVLELAAAPLRTLHRLAAWSRDYPRTALAVATSASLAWLAADALEAGAVAVVTSPRQAEDLARMALAHLARVPRPPQELTERVWSELPWR